MASLLDLLPGGALLDIGKSIIDKVVPDKNAAEQAKAKLEEAHQAGDLQRDLGNISVNIEEAKSSSVFVAGWRPWIGWVCGFSLAYAALFEPFLRFLSTVLFQYHGAFPVIDTNLTMQVVLGMLGMGAMRSFDKKNGTAA